MKKRKNIFLNFPLPTKVSMASTLAISFIKNKFSHKYLLISKISLYQAFLIPIQTQLQLKKNNYKHVLQDLNIADFKSEPPGCTCSQFTYNMAGHFITGDFNIVNNISLWKVLSNGPKYREPKPINWQHNFKILMESVEDYAR